ncbi:MAG: ribosomal RNA small subunit methyltransferase A, partial [Chloroflexi bacterium]|nr:ribosomal RNA small subunit methyltransferase A [Chloroflexota bacterium]
RRKALGQHWLVDRRVLRRIVRAADFSPEDTVVEVGAGRGLLTELLARRASRLIAVEVDQELAASLRERFRGRDNVSVLEADVLSLSPEEVLGRGEGGLPYVVVGNLPYFIGSAIVRHYLRARAQPRWLLVTLQAEVARNIAAVPGQMSYLSVEMQYHAWPRLLFQIPASAFRPPPKVRSAALRLETREGTAVEVDDREAYFRLVRAGFAAPRKQLRNALAIGLACSASAAEAMLDEAGVEPTRRAQTLTLEEWRALYRAHIQAAAGVS